MANVPQLRDLRIELASGALHLSLFERGPYPPMPAADQASALDVSPQFESQWPVDEQLLKEAATGGPWALQALSFALEHASEALWRRFEHGLARPEDDGHGLAETIKGRLEIIEHPLLWAIPWGKMPWPGSTDRVGEQVTVLLRRPEPWRPQRPLSLPLSVGQVWPDAATPSATRLVDAFGLDAQRDGLLALFDHGEYRSNLAIRHVAAAPEAPLPLTPITRRGGARLVILEDLGPTPRLTEATAWAATALSHEAAAVVYLHAGPLSSQVLPELYRALLHDVPVDLALSTALRRAGATTAEGRVFARYDGELSVQLARLLLEGIEHPDQLLVRGGGPLFFGMDEPDRGPGPPSAAGSRRERLGTYLSAPIFEARDDLHAHIREQVARALAGTPRDAESHYHQAIRQIGASMFGQAERVRALDEMASRLRALGSEQTARALRAWLSSGPTGSPRQAPLATATLGAPAVLHVDIGAAQLGTLAYAAFPEQAMLEHFQRHNLANLTVALYARDADLQLSDLRQTIELPRLGKSTVARFTVTPRRAGVLGLRVCLFHQNRLLQSMRVSIPVHDPAEATAEPPEAMEVELDWDACPDLALLDELGDATDLMLWTNDARDGTHQMGVWKGDASEPLQLLWDFAGHDAISALASTLREALYEVAGFNDKVWAPSVAEAMAGTGKKWSTRQEKLVSLAAQGATAWGVLFQGAEPVGGDLEGAPVRLRDIVQGARRLTIARCRATSGSLPWAALYSLPLDVPSADAGKVQICPVFLSHLTGDPGALASPARDLLDDQAACLAQPTCPRGKPNQKLVVCPFGFLGISQEIEQPLKQLPPADSRVKRRPGTLFDAELNLRVPATVKLTMAAYPFQDVSAHLEELKSLAKGRLSVELNLDRDEVITALENLSAQIVYFYCHCSSTNKNDDTKGGLVSLTVGKNKNGVERIVSTDIGDLPPWREKPLIFVNACESLATTPDRFGDFLRTFAYQGAPGVIGTEIKVSNPLARRVAEQVLEDLLSDQPKTLGQSFLRMRRQLLRELNPLGLAYTYYANADLRLVTEQKPEPDSEL